ncbi:MAG TPA: hypothetical protein VMB66_13070 [Candidatus Acidoferrales bacterium]|nr:hypothetical protein [Candidatus Acidoferrales bacterium]
MTLRLRGSSALLILFLITFSTARAQTAQPGSGKPNRIPTSDYLRRRSQWFYRGRLVRGEPSAELRRRAYQAKLKLRALRAQALAANVSGQVSLSVGTWAPLGPAPLASDASGNGTQNYGVVSGRSTSIAIDPADPTGNTIYIGGAQSGIWKSTNGAISTANTVTWTPITDNQATLSIGAISIQPGNSDPTKSLILAATGEADNSADSYFGLGILRSADGGNTWNLISTANSGALSLTGLGGTQIAFSSAQTSSVVAAMATSSEGLVDGAVTAATTPGLYTSADSGQTWTYDVVSDPGGPLDATSATSVVYNSGAGQFFSAIRYHGFYSSPDGVNWTRLSNQPGGSVLTTAACPPQSTSNGYACPIYRGEIAVVPGRNEMYVWYVSLGLDASPVDQGIWQSLNGGASWTAISETGITNCGDDFGCGVQQGSYNLALAAVPNGAATDLYAGAVNLYKCSLNSANPTCGSVPFMNLTHAYGCDPTAAPAHVHPDQHALAAIIPATGSDSGNALMYFANDGGIYRSLNGFLGLNTGSCSGTNPFDDLNQNLGSMTQFVGFSQHPTDMNTILGGAQGNGFPATSQATTNPSWLNVLGGDGAYTAIDLLANSNWYASNPDVPPGGLGIQLCSSGVNCTDSGFDYVVTSSTLGGDDGGFYVPYILDSSSATTMLVGTCRVWRGPRTGGLFTELSPNFETLGSGTCSGSEVNQVRALAAGGLTDNNGSSVIYATTAGLGPLDSSGGTPGGQVWVTTDASAGISAFVDLTNNGPQGSINPNEFPISSVALDSSILSGNTAYITVMGFTGGAGHVWKTTNAGATWTDFTGNLPDSPANAVVVYPAMSEVFVATDVGVFGSSTSSPSWTELGPSPSTNQAGFLPNAAVTGLEVFASGGQQLLRASTYGRGIWQFNLVIIPDFQLAVTNSPLTVFAGQTSTFDGTITAVDGYGSSVTLSCSAGLTSPPSTCSVSPSILTPGSKTAFTVTVGGAAADYNFNVKAVGSDAAHVTHTLPVTLHLISFGLTTPSPASVSVAQGSTSSPAAFQVTAAGSFNQSVSVSCSTSIAGAVCNLTPGTTVNPTSAAPVNMTASVTVPTGTPVGSYPVTLQATTAGAPSALSTSFTLNVTSNPNFTLSEPIAFPEINAGSTGTTGSISITAQQGFSGTVALSCPATYGQSSCNISPSSVNSFPATATLTINGSSFSPGTYSLSITGTSGSLVHTLAIPFSVGDYSLAGPQTVAGVPASQAKATFTLASTFFYSGKITATCDASSVPGAVCTLSPANPIALASGGTVNLGVTISVPSDATPGAYTIKINTQDTTGAPAHSASMSLTLAQDFRLTSSTPTQTVTAGQTSGPYNLTIQPVGSSFNSEVSLACTSGLPAQAQCIFSPSGPVTPGSSAVDVVMNISTQAGTSKLHWQAALWLVVPGIFLACNVRPIRIGKRNRFRLIANVSLILLLLSTLSCGGVSTSSTGGGGTTNPVTYQVTVTGSSSGTTPDAGQTTMVVLIVD